MGREGSRYGQGGHIEANLKYCPMFEQREDVNLPIDKPLETKKTLSQLLATHASYSKHSVKAIALIR